jgi:hypothetical protein
VRLSLALVLFAATGRADSSLPVPPAAGIEAVEVQAVPARGALAYRVGLRIESGYGCGQGGNRTTEELSLELAVDADNRASLRAVGERRHASWGRGYDAGGKRWHHEEKSPVDITFNGRATRSDGVLVLDLTALATQHLHLECRPADVPFHEADSATVRVLECRHTLGEPVPTMLLGGAERWPLARGRGVWAAFEIPRDRGAQVTVSLLPPAR